MSRRGKDERRSSKRLPIELDVRYKLLEPSRTLKLVGSGRTLNISSKGILFTAESVLPRGERVEVSVSWPARLHGHIPLKLVVVGRLVRVEDKRAAIAIESYEFRTSRSAKP